MAAFISFRIITLGAAPRRASVFAARRVNPRRSFRLAARAARVAVTAGEILFFLWTLLALGFSLLVVRLAESAAAPADLYDAVQPWRHLIGVVELAPAPEAARERFQAVFGRSDGVFLVRPDGYVGFASGEHAWTRQLDAYCRLWLSAPAQVHTHAG